MNDIIQPFIPVFRILWCAIGLIFALKLFFLWFNSPARRGARGEKAIARRLLIGLPDEYITFNDIYLPLPDGTTTQIDHVVVSQYGVFVIETKTYSGWIFGDEKSAQWTQSIYRKKSRFQNPLRQNYKHICALSGNLGIDKSYFHNIVVFNGNCTIKTEMPENVVYAEKVVQYIRQFATPMIKESQVEEVALAIIEWLGTVGDEQKANHVANLKKRHSSVKEGDAPLCPYCGCEMVLRKRRGDGKSFYGCSHYPACRGVIDVE